MRDLEKELYVDMVKLYKESEVQTKYKRVKLLHMLNSGAKPSEVVKRIIYVEGGSFDFEVLKKKNRLDLSVEAIVLKNRYADLFSDREKEWCRLKLHKCGYDFKE